jgi:hypothetical protein
MTCLFYYRLLRRENKGKNLPLFTLWRKREQRRRHGSCRLWRIEYRDEALPLVRSGEEENKDNDMAPAECEGESTETKTYLLYVVEKKITKTTTSMVM